MHGTWLPIYRKSVKPLRQCFNCVVEYLSSALRSLWLLVGEVSFPAGVKFELVEGDSFHFHLVVETAVFTVDLKELELAPVPIPHLRNAKSLISRKKKQLMASGLQKLSFCTRAYLQLNMEWELQSGGTQSWTQLSQLVVSSPGFTVASRLKGSTSFPCV